MHARNPYTGEVDYEFAAADATEVAATARRLRERQPDWAERSLEERLAVLQSFGACLEDRREKLVAALVADTGRTGVAALEVETLGRFIGRTVAQAPAALAAPAPRAAQIPFIEGTANRIPLGVIGNISPWNFPVILSFLDTFPALAAGNAVLIKPSEVTPRWVEPVREAIEACPDLAAVLAFAPGDGATGAAVIDHVDGVVFTGSVETGRKVAEAAARRFIPVFLELGGKDPGIVLPGADLELAARTLTFCSVQSAGQACQSIERVYVPDADFESFVERAVAHARKIGINYPDIASGAVGPFILAEQARKVLEQIDDAVARGATVQTGGRIVDHGGLWMEPTVITGVTHDMQLMQEETFGPVMPIMAYASVDEAVRLANDSRYGLSAAVFAATLDEGRAFARRIRAGAVSVNDAALTVYVHDFEHDAFGYSGMGRSRSGLSAYTRFTREQSVMSNTAGTPLMLQDAG